MKRRLVCVLCMLIWVSGCAAQMPAQPVTHSFCSELTVTGEAEPFAGTLTVTETTLTWALTAPESVAGCVLTCDGETLTVTPPEGETLTAEAGLLPADGIVPVLWNVLRTADPAAVGWQDGDGVMTGEVTGGRYTLLTDAVSGTPKSLRLTGGSWLVVFTKTTLLDA